LSEQVKRRADVAGSFPNDKPINRCRHIEAGQFRLVP
jgi:hypothetical protein